MSIKKRWGWSGNKRIVYWLVSIILLRPGWLAERGGEINQAILTSGALSVDAATTCFAGDRFLQSRKILHGGSESCLTLCGLWMPFLRLMVSFDTGLFTLSTRSLCICFASIHEELHIPYPNTIPAAVVPKKEGSEGSFAASRLACSPYTNSLLR